MVSSVIIREWQGAERQQVLWLALCFGWTREVNGFK